MTGPLLQLLAMIIKNNIPALNALRNTDAQYRGVQNSLEKLSSGSRLPQAKEGPAATVMSENMKGRIVSLRQTRENNEVSSSLLRTAEGSLSEVSEILNRMLQLAVQASNEAVNDDVQLEANQAELEFLMGSIDRLANNTTFGERSLLDGSRGVSGTMVGDNLTFVSATEETQPSPVTGFPVDITAVATKSYLGGSVPLTVENIGEGFSVTVRDFDDALITFDTRRGESGRQIREALDNYEASKENEGALEQASLQIRKIVENGLQKAMDSGGVEVDVSFTENGYMVLQHKEYGSKPHFHVASTLPGLVGNEANTTVRSLPGKDVQGAINNEPAQGKGQYLRAGVDNPAEGVTIRYDVEVGVEEKIEYDDNGAIKDVQLVVNNPSDTLKDGEAEGYLHISQQSMQVNLGTSERSLKAFSIPDVRTEKISTDVKNRSDFRSLADVDVTTIQGARDSILLIREAIDEVSGVRADLGAFQKRIDKITSHVSLATDQSTEANSVIADSDVAAEMAQLAKKQIQMSAGQAMLSQANQNPESVMQLLTAQ
jgi:flagellin